MKRVSIQAPAKINLHLEVGRLRSDGFHDICSLFQAVSLFDDIRLELTDQEEEILIQGDFPCPPEENLIYKSINIFRESCPDHRGILVQVEKRIPSEAGLGGGSSDAAAVLKGLVLLLDHNPGEQVLFAMASRLGSDVPFFLKYPSAAVSGRGEILEEMKNIPNLFGVIIQGSGEGVSTRSAYRAVDRAMEAGILSQYVLSKEDMIESYLHSKPSDWPFFNSFMETYRKGNKPLEFIFKLLYDAEAIFVGLSGSGSALFGLFPTQRSAMNAERSLTGQFPFVERINFLNSIPDAVVI
ncbi:4-(cytidine 5'-diphospho)-2-C-methyl-D-erythritol kinase [Oceanispirochaeta sp.]|jgi:4-diphosphocytidyl-2-C-methyl-D-erythritol kinase|uniref:4-(cytidine 5'-diphospho)-2-C-methyl-D-erythritol kinase n=1 Tax=Oceanispirochaeta sp. TaxID=2035350 RepID=UPI002629D368|nr:4-(cytidine 5'-diphospho)-2-C-methyl-D-erythritol kinase [Oceanispirochaeta sp.]MDA3955334.1 4-(cytidine 5'-diphospho)-2-C-methyl-D-erythritol kinase [Oceanispirochaeta sp.]